MTCNLKQLLVSADIAEVSDEMTGAGPVIEPLLRCNLRIGACI